MKDKLLALWDSERLQSFIKENRDILIKVAASALLVVAAFFVFAASSDKEEESHAEEASVVTEREEQGDMILVDIGGEVLNPMVAELEEGSRVEDAIKAAGGVTENADLTEINRAGFLEDGDKILIPAKAAEESFTEDTSKGSSYSMYSDGRVNINTADSQQLQTLDGIGPAMAEKIIAYRQENGRFRTIEDIKNVSGIGEKTFDKLKDNIRT